MTKLVIMETSDRIVVHSPPDWGAAQAIATVLGLLIGGWLAWKVLVLPIGYVRLAAVATGVAALLLIALLARVCRKTLVVSGSDITLRSSELSAEIRLKARDIRSLVVEGKTARLEFITGALELRINDHNIDALNLALTSLRDDMKQADPSPDKGSSAKEEEA